MRKKQRKKFFGGEDNAFPPLSDCFVFFSPRRERAVRLFAADKRNAALSGAIKKLTGRNLHYSYDPFITCDIRASHISVIFISEGRGKNNQTFGV